MLCWPAGRYAASHPKFSGELKQSPPGTPQPPSHTAPLHHLLAGKKESSMSCLTPHDATPPARAKSQNSGPDCPAVPSGP